LPNETFPLCAAGSVRSLVASPPKRPESILGTQAMRKIHRNLL
jgi:hypothetical protein